MVRFIDFKFLLEAISAALVAPAHSDEDAVSQDNWFRNKTWSDKIAAAFEEKLRRARRKEQYLRIQACTLARSNPEVALALLDRYFELPDDFDHAQAHVDRATAFLAQGRIEEALCAYEAALERESAFPNLKTEAYLAFPFLVATSGLSNYYARALRLLGENQPRLMFPVDHFRWNAAHALIAHAKEEPDVAYSYAKAAIEAAAKVSSGFRHHPSVGLVNDSLANVVERLRGLCST